MGNWSLTEEDRLQARELGISEKQICSQIRIFEKSSCFVRLERPCTVGDGIHQVPAEHLEWLRQVQGQAAGEGRFIKFVPASGAASRMFQGLSYYLHQPASSDIGEIRQQAAGGEDRARGLIEFLENLDRFAFWEDLRDALAVGGAAESVWRDPVTHWRTLLDYLLTKRGLEYAALPKGLLKFHRYPDGGRTAFEEHLVEAVHYVRDARNRCRLHFTVSPEHREGFSRLFESLRKPYEDHFQVQFEVSFSEQARSTDTIAVDLDNHPFRDGDGRLLFRPAGHGALLDNLNSLRGDLIYIKNIDNVVPDRLKEPTIVWKQVLGGYLVTLEKQVHALARRLAAGVDLASTSTEAAHFVGNELGLPLPNGFPDWPGPQCQAYLLGLLNRPLRVCGMVRNVGEPGGGPFWVRAKDGSLSRQIVESAQVDLHSDEQRAVWSAATHFNPVDLVCAVRNHRGQAFDLSRYVDPEAVFIAQKSKHGRELKALERPGLWNGAMSDWITVFVEVPRITFNPVKTVSSLLAAEHQ